MAVMLPRDRWTDDRLDQFEKRVDERFDRFEREVALRSKQVNERFEQVDKRFDRIEGDIGELRAITVGGFVTLLVAIVGASAF
ncbi:MAG TPA: hypothetical protein VN733_08980 [Solirubrobacterales bacterium]|nr:hypothetical protein [Solirubrobacterales bacterium]